MCIMKVTDDLSIRFNANKNLQNSLRKLAHGEIVKASALETKNAVVDLQSQCTTEHGQDARLGNVGGIGAGVE